MTSSSSDAKVAKDLAEQRRDSRYEHTTDGSDHASRALRRAGFEKSYPRANDPQRWNGVDK